MNRRWRLGLLCTAAGLLGLALAVVLIAALQRPDWRWRLDLSQSGEARLSSRSVQALEGLPDGATLAAFLLPEDPSLQWFGATVYPQAFDRLRSYLQELSLQAGERLTVQVVEANSPLVRQQQLAQQVQRKAGELLVFQAGQQRQTLSFADLFQVIQAEPDGRPARLHRQRIDAAVAGALHALAAAKQARLALVTGSGQGAIDDAQGLGPLAQLLQQEGHEVLAVRGPAEALSQDADLLIVAGQPHAFLPADVEAAQEWLAQGRPLLLAVGAFADPAVLDQWNPLLEPYGTAIEEGLVCEPIPVPGGGLVEGRSQVARLEVAPDQLSANHPISLSLVEAKRYLLFPSARPLAFHSGSNDFGQERLVRSRQIAWVDLPGGEAFARNAGESLGIRALAVAAAPWIPATPPRSGRVVVLGSAEVLRQALPLDQEFVTATCAWLLGDDRDRQGLVALGELPYHPAPASLVRLHNLIGLAIPGICFLLSLWIFWRRRR